MKTKILVTGATGKTGLPLAEHLAHLKVPFRALVHTSSKVQLLNKLTTDVVVGDYADAAAMERAFDGIERVYLLSPPAPDQFKVQSALVNIAKKSGVKHIVKLSALGTSTTSPVGLLRSHAEIESYIKDSGIKYTFLHPHFFMENLLGNTDSVRRDGAIYSPLGDAGISTVSVQDIAAVAATILTGMGHEGKTYTLTGPEAVTYDGIAATLGEVLKRKVVYVPVTFEAAKQGMMQAGMPDWFAEDIIRLMKTWAEGSGSKVTRDVEKIIGRKPISIGDFLACYKNMFMKKTGKAA